MESDIIKRAYDLAPQCSTVIELRSKLAKEGYSNVDGHLASSSLRKDLTKLLKRRGGVNEQSS